MTQVTDYVFVAELNDAQIQNKLGEIDRSMESLAKKIATQLGKVEKAWVQNFDKAKSKSNETASAIIGNIQNIGKEIKQVQELGKTPVKLQATSGGRAAQRPADIGGSDAGGKELLKNLSRFPEVNQALGQLVQTYGAFNIQIDKSGEGLNEQTQQFLKLVNAQTTATGLINQIANEYGEINAKVDASTVSSKNLTSATLKEGQLRKGVLRESLELGKRNVEQLRSEQEFENSVRQAKLSALEKVRQREAAARQEEETARQTRINELQQQAEKEVALQAKIEKAQIKAQQTGGQRLLNNLRQFDSINNGIAKLVKQYGVFNIAIDQNGQALNEQTVYFLDLVQGQKNARTITQQLIQQYGGLTATIDAATPKTISFSKSWTELLSKLKLAKASFEAIINAIKRVSSFIFKLGKAGVDTAQNFENLQIAFTNVLNQSSEAAENTFRFVRQLSRQYGTDAGALANAFLPLLESTDQLDQIAKSASGLKRLSTIGGKTQTDADVIRVIAEGLSGEFRSLRNVFELTFAETDKIKASFQELGSTGFLEGLDEVLAARGVDFDSFANTIDVRTQQIKQSFQDLRADFGTPIKNSIEEILGAIQSFISENEDALRTISFLVGEFGKGLLELATGGTLDDLQTNGTEALASLIFFVEKLNRAVIKLNTGFKLFNLLIVDARQRAADIGEEAARIAEETGRPFKEVLDELKKESRVDVALEGLAILDEGTQSLEDFTAEYAAFVDGLGKGVDKDIINANLPGGNAFADEQDQEKLLDQTTDILLRRLEIEKDFAEKQIELEEDAAKERAKIDEKYLEDTEKALERWQDTREKSEQTLADALEDIEIKRARKEQELQEDSRKKLLEIEEKYLEELGKLRRQFEFDAQEAIRQNDALAFLRLRRKLAFDLREAKIKNDQDRKNALDAEREKGTDLQKEYEQQIEDANRANQRRLRDAQKVLNDELAEARAARKKDLDDQAANEAERLAQLKTEYEARLKEFDSFIAEKEGRVADQIANELAIIAELNGKILDKESEIYQLRLEAFTKFQQDQKRLIQNSDILRAAIGSPFGVAADAGVDERGRETEGAETESDAVYAARLRQTAFRIWTAQNQRTNPEIYNTNYNRIKSQLADSDVEELVAFIQSLGAVVPKRRITAIKGRAMGGSILGGNTYLVGEQGPEMLSVGNGFMGKITPLADPNNFNIPISGIRGASINNSRNMNVDLSMLDPTTLSPAQLSIITNLVQQVLLQATSGVI